MTNKQKKEQKSFPELTDNNKNGELSDYEKKIINLKALQNRTLKCTNCELRAGCRQVVFGEGNPGSPLMLVGEAPGLDEDRQGIPFVGRAGNLLNQILAAVNLNRDEVYITNVVKCRPAGNRLPAPGEVKTCLPVLQEQISIIKPRLIVCLGALATKTLVDSRAMITRVRGNWVLRSGYKIMPTFHPAALLRDQNKKRPVWLDFQEIEKEYRKISDEESINR